MRIRYTPRVVGTTWLATWAKLFGRVVAYLNASSRRRGQKRKRLHTCTHTEATSVTCSFTVRSLGFSALRRFSWQVLNTPSVAAAWRGRVVKFRFPAPKVRPPSVLSWEIVFVRHPEHSEISWLLVLALSSHECAHILAICARAAHVMQEARDARIRR